MSEPRRREETEQAGKEGKAAGGTRDEGEQAAPVLRGDPRPEKPRNRKGCRPTGLKYQEPQSCTECALMDRCNVRHLCSFLFWEAEDGARGTMDSQCGHHVRDEGTGRQIC
ncbi:uncharacterized protein FYW23_000077 [Sylvia borin]